MFWSGFILISLVPVNSSVLQGTELDQTVSGAGASAFTLFPPTNIRIWYFSFSFQTQNRTEKRRDVGWVWRTESWRSLPVPGWGEAHLSLMGETTGRFRFAKFFLFKKKFRPTNTSQDSVRMGRGSVTFSNMVDMMGISGEDGETEDCDERAPLLCPGSRFS